MAEAPLYEISRDPEGRPPRRYFFFEERLPEAAYGVRRVYGPVSKHPARLAGNPAGVNTATFAGSIVKLAGGGYRLYATSYLSAERTMEITAWESERGLDWKPVRMPGSQASRLGKNVVRIKGLKDRLLSYQPQVFQLGPKNWVMYAWNRFENNHLSYLRAVSADGLDWRADTATEPVFYHPSKFGLGEWVSGVPLREIKNLAITKAEALECMRLASNDSVYLYHHPETGCYDGYAVWLHPAIPDRRVEVDNASSVLRLIQRRWSRDGRHWSDPELVISPDERDPWDLQFYYLAVQWHRDWRIGSLGRYRVEDGQQTMDLELCFSRDGRKWERPMRAGFIPRPPESSGEIDTLMVYGPNTWLDEGKEWLCLYTGHPTRHNERVEKRTGLLGARFRKDRLAGLAADRAGGGFLSEPFILAGPELRVDAAVRGWLRAELCDAFGRKLPGFHLMDCRPLTGDREAHRLTWKKGNPGDHIYRALRLRFEFCDAEIYNFSDESDYGRRE
ncbi:MAG: hypothetical protein BWY73_01022 [candidate division TA06 bacterium ADurb.Bin417]|uniref:Sialidase domain-containing protein n=1 Tax=candidate division TA06 bacterium ADurb.Bin417 TaxID=1852828 RepID=A0A1V5MEQ7_UNCT6|nr:MAG: hypothetical protein BWY73_01022 [candidate division TA06 bacterium ADurb.Bin417]